MFLGSGIYLFGPLSDALNVSNACVPLYVDSAGLFSGTPPEGNAKDLVLVATIGG